jgi:hypothetical protein
MARKNATQAKAELESDKKARIRYLLRNPSFQREFNELRSRVRRIGDFLKQLSEVAAFESRWGIECIACHPALYQRPDDRVLDSSTVPHFEKILTSDLYQVKLIGDIGSFTADGRLWLHIDLNSNRTVDSVLAVVEQEIRRSFPKRKKRKRLDSVNFNLAVFDLVIQRKTFYEIKKILGKPISTVKSAFLAATREIFGEPKFKRDKSIYFSPMDNPSTHLDTCEVCKRAMADVKGVGDFCPEFLAFVNQDYVPQREMTSYDTTERAFLVVANR